MKQKIITFFKSKDFYTSLIRYYLSLSLIPYAISKIMQTQFVLLPFSYWEQPLETLSGKNITWAFFGYSPWFQVLLGILEFLPAVLLLFRRTTFLGAILLLPMTLNVFLVNHALDLWSATKQISLTLLILNILILLFEWRKIKTVIGVIIDKNSKLKYVSLETLFSVVLLILSLYFSISDLSEYKNQQNFLTGKWSDQKPNEWTLVSEKINDSIQKPRLLKSYFGAYGAYSEINNNGFTPRDSVSYTINEKTNTLKFTNNKDSSVTTFTYTLLDSNVLELRETDERNSKKMLVQHFKKRIINSK